MKYASTLDKNGIETVVVVLPLEQVPLFDPANPPQPNTYGVDDSVQIGWVKSGDAFVSPPTVPPTPVTTVTMRQARLQLAVLGKYQDVNNAVASMGDAAQIEWEYAIDVERSNAITQAMIALLGWTEVETDAYFEAASKL
jgi:hypothetical protein